jgi:hypothetical protein
VNGQALHFYLAGINNQNFLMRDRETGTWWQQINGKAIFGPLQGSSLDLVPYDELSFGEWKAEVSGGLVLAPIPKYKKEYDPKWEPEVAKLPVVLTFPGTELKSRDVVVGVEIDGASRCYPWDQLVKQSPVIDHVGGKPVLVAVAADGKSFRAFYSQIDGKDAEFFLKGAPGNDSSSPASPSTTSEAKVGDPAPGKKSETSSNPPAGDTHAPSAAGGGTPVPVPQAAEVAVQPWLLIDSTSGSEWNFQGCAVSGPHQGKCLHRIAILKDYWFDWRNYHPDTTIYKR